MGQGEEGGGRGHWPLVVNVVASPALEMETMFVKRFDKVPILLRLLQQLPSPEFVPPLLGGFKPCPTFHFVALFAIDPALGPYVRLRFDKICCRVATDIIAAAIASNFAGAAKRTLCVCECVSVYKASCARTQASRWLPVHNCNGILAAPAKPSMQGVIGITNVSISWVAACSPPI